MKKIIALIVTLCLLCCPIVANAAEITEGTDSGSAVISTTVPNTHIISVTADNAKVFLDGEAKAEFSVERLSTPKLLVRAESGYKIKSITLNGADVTDKLSGGYLTVEDLYEDKTLVVTTEKEQIPANVIKFTVKGTVTKNGEPLENATVELRSTLKSTVTAKDGTFTFKDVESGKHSLTVLENGKVVGFIEFTLKTGTVKNFELLSDGTYLVTIPTNTDAIHFDFNIKDDGTVEIKDMDVTEKKPANTDSPQTGDNTNIWLWFIVLIVSGGMLLLIATKKRKAQQ